MVRLASPRAIAWLAVAAGLASSMNAEDPPIRPRVMKAGYVVLAADFHVHSFPGDGALPPWDLAVEARRRHLDAIALTNHNSTHSWRLSEWLFPGAGRAAGVLLLPGDELTSVGYHVAVVGVTAPIPWHQPAASAAAAIHAAGGVAIAAHPIADPVKDSWPFLDDAALAALDGVEVAHPMLFVTDKWRRQSAGLLRTRESGPSHDRGDRIDRLSPLRPAGPRPHLRLRPGGDAGGRARCDPRRADRRV